MRAWISNRFGGDNNKNTSNTTEEAPIRDAVIRAYFFNDSKSCHPYEVLFLKRDFVCPAPVLVKSNVTEEFSSNTTNFPTSPDMNPCSNIDKYNLSGIIFVCAVVPIALWFLRRLSGKVKGTKQSSKTKNMNSQPTVLVIGAPKTGKRSVISAFKSMYPKSQLWNFVKQNYTEHRIPNVDVIWLVINYQGSIHENELAILQLAKQIPVILIINKVDPLQEMNIDDQAIPNFNEEVPDCLKNNNRLVSIRERLMDYGKPMIILSLRQEEDFDRAIGIHNLFEMTNKYLSNQKTIPNHTAMNNRNLRVLLIGYISTGKSSLINSFAGRNIAAVSLDGQPLTKKIEEYSLSDLNLTLIDSMGFEKKRNNINKFETLTTYPQPDFIWFFLNYNSSIIANELNLINELFPSIPTIIIVNFMDVLQDFPQDIDFETETLINNSTYQEKKQYLLQFKQNHANIRHIVATSLRSEEENDQPRGLKLLYEKTIV